MVVRREVPKWAPYANQLQPLIGALGVEPVWEDGPAWTGRFSADRAHAWGWTPTVALPQALAEIEAGLR